MSSNLPAIGISIRDAILTTKRPSIAKPVILPYCESYADAYDGAIITTIHAAFLATLMLTDESATTPAIECTFQSAAIDSIKYAEPPAYFQPSIAADTAALCRPHLQPLDTTDFKSK